MVAATVSEGELDVWDDDSRDAYGDNGIYVAISGNTSAGKSSLIRAVHKLAREQSIPVLGIGERLLHHPYLRLMFAEPSRYAFAIQLNFVLQRHLVLLRNLHLGRTVVIERSHLDDELFVREHAEQGHLAADQLRAYRGLADALGAQIPMPDVLVLMNPTPQTSLRRLRLAERSGERPCEFPDELAKERWVRRWHALYETFHDHLRQQCRRDPRFAATRIIEHDPELAPTAAAKQILGAIQSQLAARRGPWP